jgi:hypothetical protein
MPIYSIHLASNRLVDGNYGAIKKAPAPFGEAGDFSEIFYLIQRTEVPSTFQ